MGIELPSPFEFAAPRLEGGFHFRTVKAAPLSTCDASIDIDGPGFLDSGFDLRADVGRHNPAWLGLGRSARILPNTASAGWESGTLCSRLRPARCWHNHIIAATTFDQVACTRLAWPGTRQHDEGELPRCDALASQPATLAERWSVAPHG